MYEWAENKFTLLIFYSEVWLGLFWVINEFDERLYLQGKFVERSVNSRLSRGLSRLSSRKFGKFGKFGKLIYWCIGMDSKDNQMYVMKLINQWLINYFNTMSVYEYIGISILPTPRLLWTHTWFETRFQTMLTHNYNIYHYLMHRLYHNSTNIVQNANIFDLNIIYFISFIIIWDKMQWNPIIHWIIAKRWRLQEFVYFVIIEQYLLTYNILEICTFLR